jgi:hypothetical protein
MDRPVHIRVEADVVPLVVEGNEPVWGMFCKGEIIEGFAWLRHESGECEPLESKSGGHAVHGADDGIRRVEPI